MYSQRYTDRPHSPPHYHPFPAGGKGTKGLPPQSSRLAPTSPGLTVGDDRTQVGFHDILDSTTLAVGFDHACLDGLTAELLYTPTDAFAQSCWEILFPERDPPKLQSPKTPISPISGPPSYRTLPDFYIYPGASTSQSTIRQQDQEREEDADSFIDNESGACFWDDSDDDIEEDEYEVESQDVESFISFDDDEDDKSELSNFSYMDAIKNHPIIDTDFAVKDSLFLNDLSKVDWKPALMCWEDSLPISVVFREMPVNNKPPKLSKMAALRAKIPILPFRSTAQMHNSWYVGLSQHPLPMTIIDPLNNVDF